MTRLRPYLGTLLALGGGVAAFLGMVIPSLWFLPILGVLGYFASTTRSSSSRVALGHGLLFGVLASMGGVWWFWDTLPLTWILIPEGPIQFFLVGIVYGLTVVSLTLPFALVAPLIRRIPARWYRPFVFAFAYIGLEELRMWSFALFFLAPESMLAPNFSVAGLGYVLTESALFLPLAQAGHYGLHGFLALLSATLLERKRLPLLLGASVLLLSLLVAYATLPTEHEGSTVRVGLISSYAPPGPFVLPNLIIAPLQEAAKRGAEVIVTPEGLGLAPFLDQEARHRFYETLFAERNGLVISSSIVREENGNEHAELTYETPQEGIIGSQHKIFFVPVGEYLPPLIRIAIAAAGKENLNGYGSYIAGRAVAGSSITSTEYAGTRFGALLCSELLSPRLYARLAATDTDLLLNLANNSWFHGSHLLHDRLQQLAKTHALRNRQYVLVAANGSPAYAVNARGSVIGETLWGTPEVLMVDVPLPAN